MGRWAGGFGASMAGRRGEGVLVPGQEGAVGLRAQQPQVRQHNHTAKDNVPYKLKSQYNLLSNSTGLRQRHV